MAEPIWKDYAVNLGTASSIKYRVLVGADIIYTGRAYARPGETDPVVRLNDIAADFLTGTLPSLSGANFSALGFPVQFDVETEVGGTWTPLTSEEFYLNYSYDDTFDPTGGLADPVSWEVAPGQWLFYSTMTAGTLTATIYNSDGTTVNVYVPTTVVPDFSPDFNNDFARSLRSAGAGTVTLDLSQFPDAVSVSIEGHVWTITETCSRYVLYYRNAFGGWDSLIVKGTSRTDDALTRHTRAIEYDNTITDARGEADYAIEVAPQYTFRTGILSDDESSRMHHLLNSPDVYLHDLDAGEIRPLVLTGTTTPHKTFVGEGRTMFTYEITARLAQYRERR